MLGRMGGSPGELQACAYQHLGKACLDVFGHLVATSALEKLASRLSMETLDPEDSGADERMVSALISGKHIYDIYTSVSERLYEYKSDTSYSSL